MNAPISAPAPEARPLEFADHHGSLGILGFWLFLASDVVLFSCLFAVYAAYGGRTAGGPTPADLFHYGPALAETLLLLTSSFACGLCVYGLRRRSRGTVALWLAVTMVLGLGFVGLEVHEFASYVALGDTWHKSAWLSAFFGLVGTHGMHVSFGLLWAATLLIQVLRRGVDGANAQRLYIFSLYWHFLDIVWVFIFSAVYLAGRIG